MIVPSFEGQSLSALAQLIAIHAANGTTSTGELAKATGYSERAIWKAKAELKECTLNPGAPTPEPECTLNTAPEFSTPLNQSAPCTKEIPPTPPKENIIPTQEQPSTTTTTSARGVVSKPHWEIVSQACLTAIGAAADPNAIGLLAVGEPQAWIAEGADLELDVLPAIRELAAQQVARNQTISGWNYFAKRVARNKANRERGLPEVKPDAPKPRVKMGRYGPVQVREEIAA